MCGGSFSESAICDFIFIIVEGTKIPKDIGRPSKDSVSSLFLHPVGLFLKWFTKVLVISQGQQ